jgi:hypothetical protein
MKSPLLKRYLFRSPRGMGSLAARMPKTAGPCRATIRVCSVMSLIWTFLPAACCLSQATIRSRFEALQTMSQWSL